MCEKIQGCSGLWGRWIWTGSAMRGSRKVVGCSYLQLSKAGTVGPSPPRSPCTKPPWLFLHCALGSLLLLFLGSDCMARCLPLSALESSHTFPRTHQAHRSPSKALRVPFLVTEDLFPLSFCALPTVFLTLFPACLQPYRTDFYNFCSK